MEGRTYLSPWGVRNLNKYLAQACQKREGAGWRGAGGGGGALSWEDVDR